jgi:cystathionine beta-lyase family protein involved in aluminum resistance
VINDIDNRIAAAERACADPFARIDAIEMMNTEKVLRALQENRVASHHFAGSTGYGYGDVGREKLSDVFRDVFAAEAALVRPQIASGTHALAICLYGVLRPGDRMLSAAGKPYDTLEDVIGLTGNRGDGSLRELGVAYSQTELTEDGALDLPQILANLTDDVKLVLIQRSRGYAWRPSLRVSEINEAIDAIHKKRPDVCVMVDNCYGEFMESEEPRADLIAGSLIKNPGGGIAPTGGYIAGKAQYVEKAACRLTSPGIGAEVGSYAGSYQPFFQGLFLAPHTVAQAAKTAVLAAKLFSDLGYLVSPAFDEPRTDIIQALKLESPDRLIQFCQAIQRASPIDSEAVPEPWEMPGYQHPVIMAAGTFISGASIELSADAPIREPYIAYLQGALTYAHGKYALRAALQQLHDAGLLARS